MQYRCSRGAVQVQYRWSKDVVELEQSRGVVDVVVGERMMKFQGMQLFILEFYEILYFMRNYLPILINWEFHRKF